MIKETVKELVSKAEKCTDEALKKDINRKIELLKHNKPVLK